MLEPGDRLLVLVGEDMYANPSPEDWWDLTLSLKDAFDFASGADEAQAYAQASSAAEALGGMVIRLPVSQIPEE